MENDTMICLDLLGSKNIMTGYGKITYTLTVNKSYSYYAPNDNLTIFLSYRDIYGVTINNTHIVAPARVVLEKGTQKVDFYIDYPKCFFDEYRIFEISIYGDDKDHGDILLCQPFIINLNPCINYSIIPGEPCCIKDFPRTKTGECCSDLDTIKAEKINLCNEFPEPTNAGLVLRDGTIIENDWYK